MRTELPQIDFVRHPAYGTCFGKAQAGLKARAIAAVAPSLARFAMIEARTMAIRAFGSLRKRPGEPDYGSDFRRDGIVGLSIGSNMRARVASVAEPQITALRDRLAKIAPKDARYEDNQLPLRRGDAPDLYALIEEMLEVQGVFDLARNYMPGAIGGIKAITLQWNREGERHWRDKFADLEGVTSTADYLHVDTGSGILKAIYYVSDDVRPESGAFSYILGSNNRRASILDRVVRSAVDRSGIGRTDRESRRLFNALPRWMQRKADFGFDVVDDAAEELKRREKIFTSDEGNLVLFDNFGVHRGGMVRQGERLILQIVIW